MVHAGLHCPALLAPPLLWSCPPVLGLWGCLCALKLTLTKITEANVFFQMHPLSKVGVGVTFSTQGIYVLDTCSSQM